MIYKFKSKATGDLIMLGPQGDMVMRLLGRTPSAQGIIEVADMPQALALLTQAVADDEVARQPVSSSTNDGNEPQAQDSQAVVVGLRQRVWPLMEAIKRAHAENEPLVWGT